MSETITVGDVVPWADVPNGALVLAEGGLAVRRKVPRRLWEWDVSPCDDHVRVLSLDAPLHADYSEVQRLAEVFEVREQLQEHYRGGMQPAAWPRNVWAVAGQPIGQPGIGVRATPSPLPFAERTRKYSTRDEMAERLHAAGWRPGMTAEDAARLLAEK